MLCRQRLYELRYPDRLRARRAVADAVRRGKLAPASACTCTDCGQPAAQYDHWHGYERAHWLDVQAVCVPCHAKRPRKTPWRTTGSQPRADFRALVPEIEAWGQASGLDGQSIAARLGMSAPLWSLIRSGQRRLGLRYALAFIREQPDTTAMLARVKSAVPAAAVA